MNNSDCKLYIVFIKILMREITPSNMNYNITYCFFMPAVLYYSIILVHDISSCWLFFLSLLSFTSVFRPKKHKILHIVIAISALLDLLMKILTSIGILNMNNVLQLDLKVIENMLNIGTRVIEVKLLIYLLILILSWILVFTYNIRSKTKI